MVKIGTDLFSFNNKDYAIAVDYTTKVFKISRSSNTEALTIINHTKDLFSCYEIPREGVSDNGPQFTSHEKKDFSQEGILRILLQVQDFPNQMGLLNKIYSLLSEH